MFREAIKKINQHYEDDHDDNSKKLIGVMKSLTRAHLKNNNVNL